MPWSVAVKVAVGPTAHDRVAVRCSVSGPQAAPPPEGGVTMVRVQVSVRVCWPAVHAPHEVADCIVQALTTQLTTGTLTVAVRVTLPPGPVATSV